ncbi:MAG: hypothetical protein ACI9JN_002176 [Bacteroidia bacterium]|jgi:hypothetical protein
MFVYPYVLINSILSKVKHIISLVLICSIILLGCNGEPNVEDFEGQLAKAKHEMPLNPKGCKSERDNLNETICDGARAILASRYASLEDLKRHVDIQYFDSQLNPAGEVSSQAKVLLTYADNGFEVESELKSGVSQGDIIKVRDGTFSDRVNLVFTSPYAVSNRVDLNKIYKLSRRRPALFGEGDVAFYDLALTAVTHINTIELAYRSPADSSEKGYTNTFNHITAQAFITSIYSKQMADFIADLHERNNMAELITGDFSEDQLINVDNNPVDNYVDLINNELGQTIGLKLKRKYNIGRNTNWTAELLTNYLNDIQTFYCWSFNIGMRPFRIDDELIIRFVYKINRISIKALPYHDN